MKKIRGIVTGRFKCNLYKFWTSLYSHPASAMIPTTFEILKNGSGTTDDIYVGWWWITVKQVIYGI